MWSPPTSTPGPTSHSLAIASSARIRAALIAGHSAATIPTTTASTTIVPSPPHGTTSWSRPSSEYTVGSTEASPTPTTVDNDGCSLDQACPCDSDPDGNPWASHGKYYRCYTDEVFRFRILHLVTGEDADLLKMAARANDCGDRPPICE